MERSWKNFVFQTYNEIKTGTKIPDYFGCLKGLIETAQKNNTLPEMSPPFSLNKNDFNDENYIKSTSKRIPNTDRQRYKNSPEPLETPLTKSHINSSKQNTNEQTPQTPQSDSPYQLESFQSQTPQSSGSPSLSPESQISSQVSSQVSSQISPNFQRQYSKPSKFSNNIESDVEQETETEQHEEEQNEEEQHEEEQHENEQNEEEQYSEPHFDQSYSLSSPPPKNQNNYASKFREIGDSIIGAYWFPIETTIPRLTLESKLMSSFKVSKFKHLMNAMNDRFRVLEPHHLKFIRAVE